MLFRDVVGHDEVKRRLRQRVQNNSVAHANLFTGPPGSGAFAMALAFARYVSCRNPGADDACGVCDVCKKFDSFQYADLNFTFPIYKKDSRQRGLSSEFTEAWRSFIIGRPYPTFDDWNAHLAAEKKTLHIYVDEAAEISRRSSLHSMEGGYNIQLIWMAERMGVDTANKLLKSIEEPGSDALFLLVAESTENMLPTVLSRTQIVRLPEIDDESVKTALMQKEGCGAEQADSIARFVDGDYARALDLLRNADGHTAFLAVFRDWMRACYGLDAERLVPISADLGGRTRDAQRQFLTYALHFIRQCIVFNYSGDELAKFSQDEAAFAKRFAPFINHKNVEALNKLINEAIADLLGNLNGKIVFLDLSLKLHRELRR